MEVIAGPQRRQQPHRMAGHTDAGRLQMGGHQRAGQRGELGDRGLAAPMDTRDLDHGVFPPLDDPVLNCGSLADVVDTASLASGISDSFEPLTGLGTMLGEFTERAYLGLAPALAGIELLVLRLPSIGEMVGQSLLDGLGTRNAVLSAVAGVQPQVLSLSETVNSVLQSSAVNTLGLLDGLNPARAVLSVVEPQINNLASVLGSAARLSSMADVLQPLGGLGEFVRQTHVGLAGARRPPDSNSAATLPGEVGRGSGTAGEAGSSYRCAWPSIPDCDSARQLAIECLSWPP
ncbi:hypothetical protein ABIE67_009045 [Streptomyces sp. V4I8]|uniref:hypothetical protein n=1 Tax=Streptomyces sp. V4I8 TaxID=3156469 RepID=UPI0035149EE7